MVFEVFSSNVIFRPVHCLWFREVRRDYKIENIVRKNFGMNNFYIVTEVKDIGVLVDENKDSAVDYRIGLINGNYMIFYGIFVTGVGILSVRRTMTSNISAMRLGFCVVSRICRLKIVHI